MILLAHPTGNTFSRALLAALQEKNLLGLFATTIAAGDAPLLAPELQLTPWPEMTLEGIRLTAESLP